MNNIPTFVNANCLEYLPKLANDSIDFVLFSPPYDNLRTYKGYPPLDKIALGKELYRVAKEGAICAVVIQDQTKDCAKSLSSFRWAIDWCDQCGWKLYETIIYKRNGVPGAWKGRFRVDHEYCLLFLKGDKPLYFNKDHLKVPCANAGKKGNIYRRQITGETIRKDIIIPDKKCGGTVWEYVCGFRGNKTKHQHPATMPDKLASDLIRCFCPLEGLTLDPMAGSGTTCIAAALAGRQSLGVEVSPEYVKICRDRAKAEIATVIFSAD